MSNYLITLPDGSANTIIADAAFIDKFFPGAQLLPDPPPPAPSQASHEAQPSADGSAAAPPAPAPLMQPLD